MDFNPIEREVIGLCIAVEALDDIANHRLLDLRDVQSASEEAEVYYRTDVHQQLFTILLLDFVHERGDQALTGISGSCLDILEAACHTRSFEYDGSIALLEVSLKAFQKWLQAPIRVDLWLPSLHLKADLTIKRIDFLYTSGNQSKHNLSRLTRVSERLAKILSDNGYIVPLERVPLALDDFREHFHDNYLVYYGTWLSEMLNNLRWGVQDYLLPQYKLSHKLYPSEPGRYSYDYPTLIDHPLGREWYWRLMNRIRSGPCLKRFTGTSIFKREVLS